MSRPSRADRAPLAALAGVASLLASIQVISIVLGLSGVALTAPGAAAALAVAVVVAAAFGVWVFRDGAPEPDGSGPATGRLLGYLLTGLAVGTIGWSAWIWIQVLDIALIREPIDWDGLWYHIPAIHEWSRRGGVGFIDTVPDVPFVNHPMAVELTSFFVHRLLGTTRLVDAGNLWFWPLAVPASAVLAVRLGGRGIWPWLAGALIACCPVFLSLSATAYVDPGLASAVIAAIAAAASLGDHDAGRPWAVGAIWGMTLGLTLGAKVTGLPYAALIGVAGTTVLIGRTGLGSWRRWAIPLGIGFGFAVLVGGYWYLRNLVVTGNPLYPFQIMLGRRIIVPGWDYSYFGDLAVPEWMRAFPTAIWPLLAWWRGDAPSAEYMFSAAGLGRIWFLGGLPAVLYAWWLAWRGGGLIRAKELRFVTVVVALLLLISPIPWRSRLTIWLLALGLPALGAVLGDAAARCAGRRRHCLTLAAGAGVIILGISDARRTLAEERTLTPAAWSATGRPGLDRHFPGLRTQAGFAEALAGDRIARGRWATEYGTLLGGMLAMPLGQREIIVVPPSTGDYRDPYGESTRRQEPTSSDIEGLLAAGVEWVLWDTPGDKPIPAVLGDWARERYQYRHPAGMVLGLFRIGDGSGLPRTSR